MHRGAHHAGDHDRLPRWTEEPATKGVRHVLDNGEPGARCHAGKEGALAISRAEQPRADRLTQLLGEGGDDHELDQKHDGPR